MTNSPRAVERPQRHSTSTGLSVYGSIAFLVCSVLIASCTVTTTPTGDPSSVDLTFSVSTPTYHMITFSPAVVSVKRGDDLSLSTTNTELAGITGWRWYVDGQRDQNQTSSTFVSSTNGWQPGEYTISADVLYDGVQYSGSLNVTVTY